MPSRIAAASAVERQARGGEARRIREHLDLAHVGPLHVHPSHAGKPGEHRLDLVAGDVEQRGGIAPLEVVAQDREQAGREPLDLDVEARREIAPDLLDARAHQLQRVVHVGAFREVDVHLARAANGAALHPHHAGDDAHRLLDGPRHREHDLPRPEARALGHDRDAGEGELGVDRARQPERRPDAGRAQQCDGEVDEPSLRGERVEEPARRGLAGRGAHGFAAATLALSFTP